MKPDSALLSKRVLACLGAFFGLTVSTLYGATITWTNTSGGVWSSPLNWSPNIVPRGSDTVQITAAGTYTVRVDTNVAIQSLTLGGASGAQILTNNTQTMGITNSCLVGANGILNLGGGTLSGGLLTLQGMFNWVSGAVTGPLTIGSGGVLNISGSVTLENVLTNAGTVTMTGAANLTLYNNNGIYLGGVYNLAAALWDLQTNANISCGCYGNEFFNNAGTFRKSGSSSQATVGVNFTNTGTVTNLIGILDFSNGGSITGTYGTAAGATIDFGGGSFTMGVPPTISGLGISEFTGTTLTLTQNWPTNLVLAGGNLVLGPAFQNSGGITNLTLSGVTLTSTNRVTGTLNWVAGVVAGPLTIGSGGVLNISGSVTLENVLTNAGTVTMTGAANLTLYNNNGIYLGGVYNLAAALWDLQTNANISCGCYGNEFFNNAGTFRKSGSSSQATVGVNFTNSGTVNALAQILSFNGAFTNAGGTLAFGVSSLASFGQINVSGNVTLNGTASATWLNGFMPAVGNSFAVLDYGSHSGSFATITLPPGYLGEGIYGATVFSLMITNTTAQTNLPVFLSIKLVNPSNAVVSWPSTATNYTLQTSTNLSSGSWSNVTSGIATVSTNDVLTNQVNGKAGFFRLQSP